MWIHAIPENIVVVPLNHKTIPPVYYELSSVIKKIHTLKHKYYH